MFSKNACEEIKCKKKKKKIRRGEGERYPIEIAAVWVGLERKKTYLETNMKENGARMKQ